MFAILSIWTHLSFTKRRLSHNAVSAQTLHISKYNVLTNHVFPRGLGGRSNILLILWSSESHRSNNPRVHVMSCHVMPTRSRESLIALTKITKPRKN